MLLAFLLTPWVSAQAADAQTDAAMPTYSADNPAFPEEWKKFMSDFTRMKTDFLEHIRGATNIDIPVAHKEFKWPVNWAAQQSYCKRIAKAIFDDPQKIEFPLPDAIAARDGVAATYEKIGRAFPQCKSTPKPDTDELLRRINAGERDAPNRSYIDNWQKNYFPASPTHSPPGIGFYVGDDYFVKWVFRHDLDLNPSFYADWDAIYRPDPQNQCPTRGKYGATIEPTGSASGTFWRPSAMLLIDGRPIPVDYGVHGYTRFSYSPPPKPSQRLDRWGNKNQRYVVIRSLQHDFWDEWAQVPPKNFAREDENHTLSGLYSSCVINFDSPATAAQPP